MRMGQEKVLSILNEKKKNPLFTLITPQLSAGAKINIVNVEGNLNTVGIALGKNGFQAQLSERKPEIEMIALSRLSTEHFHSPGSLLGVNIMPVNHLLYPHLAY